MTGTERNGHVYLIPSAMGEEVDINTISLFNREIINSLDEFIVENERTARRYLKAAGYSKPLQDIVYHILNEHTDPAEASTFLKPVKAGKNIGLLSESGCPCVADPGAIIVKQAHENNIKVIPLTGSSSIMLGLMASGFNGQNFAFLGYLPAKQDERVKAIKEIDREIYRKNQTQIFIEAPYRNVQMFDDLVKNCADNTLLCIGVDLTLRTEYIKTMSIKSWRNKRPDFNKKPTIFLLYK